MLVRSTTNVLYCVDVFPIRRGKWHTVRVRVRVPVQVSSDSIVHYKYVPVVYRIASHRIGSIHRYGITNQSIHHYQIESSNRYTIHCTSTVRIISIQFNSTRFNSIQFNSIQFNSIQFIRFVLSTHRTVASLLFHSIPFQYNTIQTTTQTTIQYNLQWTTP